jgi:GNAT superfamily N-acetyltransferase
MRITEVKDIHQIETVASLAEEIWNQHFIPIIGKQQVDYMVERFQSVQAIQAQLDDGYQYYLFDNAKGYFGYTAVLPRGNELFLSKLYIKKSKRGKGYGRQALAFIESLAAMLDKSLVSLTVNRNNISTIKVYEKMGYKISGEVVKDIGNGFVMDDFTMYKPV